MKMTWELAEDLMDCLACVAVSANGGYSEDVFQENRELVEQYARTTFMNLLAPWEELMGEPWEIENPALAV